MQQGRKSEGKKKRKNKQVQRQQLYQPGLLLLAILKLLTENTSSPASMEMESAVRTSSFQSHFLNFQMAFFARCF